MCFFFNDTATTEIYTLSLHDALPILRAPPRAVGRLLRAPPDELPRLAPRRLGRGHRDGRLAHAARHAADRKSTRLNSSHANISYAVFCLKKKKINSPCLTSISSLSSI